MNQTITYHIPKIPPNSMSQVGSIVNSLNNDLAPMRKIMAEIGRDALRQQVSIQKALEPTINAIEAVRAAQAVVLPDFSATLKALELAKKSAVINVELIPAVRRKSSQENVMPEPQVRRREPHLTAEEISFVRDLMNQQEAPSIRLITEQLTSVFSWDTFDLHIDGKRIKLEPVEKTICICVFKNPNTRCMLLDTVEEMVYGAVLSDSKRLKQAIKRINTKIRRAGFDNVFSYGDGFLNVNI